MRPRNIASESSGRRFGTRNSGFRDATAESGPAVLDIVLSLCGANVEEPSWSLRFAARMFVGVPIYVNADSESRSRLLEVERPVECRSKLTVRAAAVSANPSAVAEREILAVVKVKRDSGEDVRNFAIL